MILGAGVTHFPDGLEIVDSGIIQGQGMGVTHVFFNERGFNILAQAVTIKDMTIYANVVADCAIQCKREVLFGGNRGGSSELILENVEIRPSAAGGYFKTPIDLDRLSTPKLSNIWVQGRFTDFLPDSWNNGGVEVGINVGGCQEAKLDNIYMSGCKIGIKGLSRAQGELEGFSLTNSAVINSLVPVHLQGWPEGPFKTPWINMQGNHLFYLLHGAFLHNLYDAKVLGNNMCRSHLAKGLTVGVYGVTNRVMHITGNTFWNTGIRKDSYSGVLDGCSLGKWDNIVDPSMAVGAYFSTAHGPVNGWTVT